MNPGYLYTIAGLLSFSALGVFHKLADVKGCRPSAINALLYAWSTLFSFLIMMIFQHARPGAPASVISIAIPFGISASIAILALQAGIRHGNISTSWLAINLSSGIPTVASILIYHEAVNARKAVALVLIVLSMVLLWIDRSKQERRRSSAESITDAACYEKEPQ
ncbi:MAG TPA: EamA family transporter [Bryobacteraceae bacterium]|jgi:drug/metabolite transporter (DMT)-like permease|nr:EamA family transporter [Bryobacteraceae bacterium]